MFIALRILVIGHILLHLWHAASISSGVKDALGCNINSYKMSYILPIEQGGSNDPTNLKLICPTCYQFKN